MSLLSLAGATSARAQVAGWPLLYTATLEGNADLYLFAPPALTRLTDAAGADNWAAWSPSGQYIAFQSQRDGNYEVYVVAADGSEPRNLSRHPRHDGLPVWSPDGSQIAFFSSRGLDYPEKGPIPGHIYRLPVAGGEPQQLTSEPLSSTLGPSSWSADGKFLLLARAAMPNDAAPAVAGNGRLFQLAVASGEELPLTRGEANAGGGLYSPDGKWIAYYEEGPDGAGVFLIDAAGGSRRALLDDSGWHYPYAWSPDGKWLTVTSIDAAGVYSLRAVALSGQSVVIEIDDGLTNAREASWRP